MIIDSHQHLGDCSVFDAKVTEDELINSLDKNQVDAAIVFPFPGARKEEAVHDAIHALTIKYPGRIYGLISINPHRDEKSYFAEVERCVKMGFLGLKIHPQGHACLIHTKDAEKVFIAARKFNLPVIIHTGLGVPYTLPSLVIPRAKQYSDIKIILAHAGAYIYSAEAIVTAEECPNVYLETSWCSPHRIKEFVEKLGPDRVMFGSDLPVNITTELAKYRSILDENDLEKCLCTTAKNVFKIK